MKFKILVLVIVVIAVEVNCLSKGKMTMAEEGNEEMIKSTKLGYFGGNTIDNHHSIPRDQFGYAGHGNSQPSSGGEERRKQSWKWRW